MGEHVSMKVLARKIAEEMNKYIVSTLDCAWQRDSDMLLRSWQEREREKGTPLMYHGRHITLDRLALKELRQVAGGSWEPVFAIRI